jgi:hypothetical protein
LSGKLGGRHPERHGEADIHRRGRHPLTHGEADIHRRGRHPLTGRHPRCGRDPANGARCAGRGRRAAIRACRPVGEGGRSGHSPPARSPVRNGSGRGRPPCLVVFLDRQPLDRRHRGLFLNTPAHRQTGLSNPIESSFATAARGRTAWSDHSQKGELSSRLALEPPP